MHKLVNDILHSIECLVKKQLISGTEIQTNNILT